MADVTSRLRLVVDSTGLDRAGRKLKDLRRGAASVDQAAQRLRTAFAGLAGVLGGAAFLRTLNTFNDQARAMAKVEQAVRSTGGAAGFAAAELQKVAGNLQKITLFDDDKILNEVTAQLLTFTNIAGDQFLRTQKAALDLATVLDGDLKSASIQLGKALNDPVANLSALSRSGIQFSKSQKEVINSLVEAGNLAKAQVIILDELERQYGGQAEAAAKVGTGILKQLENVFGDIQERLGGELFAVLTPSITALMAFLTIDENQVTVVRAIEGVGAALAGVIAILTAPAIGAGIAALLSPIGLVVVAVGALVAFRDDIAEWAFGVKDAGAVVKAAIEVLGPVFNDLFNGIKSFVTGSLRLLAEFAQGVANILAPITDAINLVAGTIVEAANRTEIERLTNQLEALANKQRDITDLLIAEQTGKFKDAFDELATQVNAEIGVGGVDALRAELGIVNEEIDSVSERLNRLLDPGRGKELSGILGEIRDRANEISTESGLSTEIEAAANAAGNLGSAITAASKDATAIAKIFSELEVERRALLAGSEREAEIIRVTNDLLAQHAKHYAAIKGGAEAAAKADAERIVDLKLGNKELEARKNLVKEIADQEEIIAAARLGEHQERIAREILDIRRQIAGISIEEARALAEQNVHLDEQLEIIHEQRALLEEPFENLASNLEDAIRGGGRAGVDGLKDIFTSFLKDLKNSFLLSLFQPLFFQIRNLANSIAVPIFGPGPGGGIGGLPSQTLNAAANDNARAAGTFGGFGGFNLQSLASLGLGLGSASLGGASAFFGLASLIGPASLGKFAAGLGNFVGLPGGITDIFGEALAGAGTFGGALGGIGGSVLSNLLFGKSTGSSIGSAIGGIAGNLIPIPVLGPLIGSLLGGAVGSLFSGKPSNEAAGAQLNLDTFSTVNSFAKKNNAANIQARDLIIGQTTEFLKALADITGSTFSEGAGLIVTAGKRGINVGGSFGSTNLAAGDVEGAVEAAFSLATKGLRGGDSFLTNLAKTLSQAGNSAQDVIETLQTVAGALDINAEKQSEYRQAFDQLNDAFDSALSKVVGITEAENKLSAARESALNKVRDKFLQDIEEQRLAQSGDALAGFRAIAEQNASILSDTLAFFGNASKTLAARTDNFEGFFNAAIESGKTVTELSDRLEEFVRVAKDAGASAEAVRKGFQAALITQSEALNKQRIAQREAFNEQVQGDIGNFLTGPLDQLEKLLEAQNTRLEKARSIGANLDEVSRLTNLELRQFFEGLSDQAVQEVQSFLGLFQEASDSVARQLDLSRQDLQSQRDTFQNFAQEFASLRTGFNERFIAASPRESLDILRGRAQDLLGQVGQGNASAAQALPQVLNQLIDSARQTFGNTQGFVEVFNFVQDILSQAEESSLKVVSDTERQIAALDENNDILSDIRDILQSTQAMNALFVSAANGGVGSSDQLLALIQSGAGLTPSSANDNASALSVTGLIAQSVQPIVAPLATSIDNFTQRLSDMPALQRLQIEATDRVADEIAETRESLVDVLERLENLSKKQVLEAA